MSRRRRTNAQMNVVPYIDVMLVLLVIFMVTAPLLQPGVVNLPKVGQAATVEQSPLEIVVKKNKRFDLKDSKKADAGLTDVSLDQLADGIQTLLATDNRPVIISADGKVKYEEVMRVVDQLQKRNIARIGLLVNTGK